MALQKPIETEFGIDAVYWNIGAVQEDFKSRGIEVTLYGYASQAAYQANRQPMAVAKFQVISEYVPEMSREDLYSLAKLQPEFTDAEDV